MVPESGGRESSAPAQPTLPGDVVAAQVQGDGPVPIDRSETHTRRGFRALLIAAALGAPLITSTAAAQQGETRRVPETLNFANGLFRDRKFELAAEEYEKFLETA